MERQELISVNLEESIDKQALWPSKGVKRPNGFEEQERDLENEKTFKKSKKGDMHDHGTDVMYELGIYCICRYGY
jgi:hypothetical protein